MTFRKTLTFFILATALVFALPAGTQQRDVAPTLRSAFCSGGVPTAGRRWETAATIANASACAAMLPALPTGTQQNPKPFTQEQVVSMVRDGFGDESGAKLIEQRGIDFAPSEDFIQSLKAAGASEAFLNALRAAVAPGLSPAGNVAPNFSSAHVPTGRDATTAASEPASAKKPLNQVQVFALLVGQVPSHRVTMLVQERGIDFEPTDGYIQEVHLATGEGQGVREDWKPRDTAWKATALTAEAQRRTGRARDRL